MINEHELAVQISKIEGKKVEVDIGQIKEVLDITLRILANAYMMHEAVELIERHMGATERPKKAKPKKTKEAKP